MILRPPRLTEHKMRGGGGPCGMWNPRGNHQGGEQAHGVDCHDEPKVTIVHVIRYEVQTAKKENHRKVQLRIYTTHLREVHKGRYTNVGAHTWRDNI